jgi:hypothetical protein
MHAHAGRLLQLRVASRAAGRPLRASSSAARTPARRCLFVCMNICIAPAGLLWDGGSVKTRAGPGYARDAAFLDRNAGVPGSKVLGQCSAPLCLVLKRLLARMTSCRISHALLVQINGYGLMFWCPMYSSMAEISSGTLVNTPRHNRSLVISRKKRSTMFSNDAEVGVKWMWKRGCLASHFRTAGCLCVAIQPDDVLQLLDELRITRI